ncbi:uncharacterized protein LOC117079183 [Trachypithecus francoisi]|uniref:uncharacterized protein LOC117079183 n=1 Tax=Trachypithecus francoisi TaxID=54180 RepID=UPI00141A742D|nr:uncharacterized protein LOC117079183 [Trachypithecus francoisi]
MLFQNSFLQRSTPTVRIWSLPVGWPGNNSFEEAAQGALRGEDLLKRGRSPCSPLAKQVLPLWLWRAENSLKDMRCPVAPPCQPTPILPTQEKRAGISKKSINTYCWASP